MYAYICRGLGVTAGAVGGWSLIWAYLGISIAGATGFSIFADTLLKMVGLNVPPVALFAICVATSWYCAWKNVQLSALLMLFFEGVSVALILVLCFIVLSQHHFAVDHAAIRRQQAAVVERRSRRRGRDLQLWSASNAPPRFGDEAKNPLKTIPNAVMVSLIISGAFFVFVTYVMVLGVRGYSTPLDKLDTPLNTLAKLAHVAPLSIPLSLGAMVSFFALNCTCINAGARVIYAMGRHGIFHEATAEVSRDQRDAAHRRDGNVDHLVFASDDRRTRRSRAARYLQLCRHSRGFRLYHAVLPYHRRRSGLSQAAWRAAPHRYRDVRGFAPAVVDPDRGQRHSDTGPPVNYFPYAYLVYLLAGMAWILRLPCAQTHGGRSDQSGSRAEPRSVPRVPVPTGSGNRERQSCMTQPNGASNLSPRVTRTLIVMAGIFGSRSWRSVLFIVRRDARLDPHWG